MTDQNWFRKIPAALKNLFPLVENWRQILKRSATVWLSVGSALLAAAEKSHAELTQLMPVLESYVTPGVFGTLSLALVALVPFARIVKQVKLEVKAAEDAAKLAKQTPDA